VSTQSKSPDRIAKRALVLLSGGLDSTVSLLWAMERFEQVDTVTIDYGENAVELEFRARTLDGLRTRFPQLVARLGDDTVLPLPGLEVLTRLPVAQSVRRHLWSRGLGTEVIIGRNVIFMALANSIAERTGITDFLVGTYGFGDRFREGLPDVIESFEKAYSTLRGTKVTIYRPLEHGAPNSEDYKVAAWKMALDIGGHELVSFLRDTTMSCWECDSDTVFEWGHGCGTCVQCRNRARTYALFQQRIDDGEYVD
jgi:7-cyano-7-deazaguanine synthase